MSDLAYVLRQIPPSNDPNLLVGRNPADDAAIYRVREDLALIQTVDFFTPIVDDPYLYGQIAATNSLSDVYAMGGVPMTALNVAAFPVKKLPADILGAILKGGADKAAEAGVPIVGGHTVDDDEPKYGLAVTGTVHPDRYIDAHGAKIGDSLILTKPLGTGIISTALKAEAASDSHVNQAVRWMTTLNRSASQAMVQTGAHAATDITGFGLLGHLVQLLEASGVAAELCAGAIPTLPGALEYADEGYLPGGTVSNLSYVENLVEFEPEVEEGLRLIMADAQTSGGLLVSLSPEACENFIQASTVDMLATQIGRIVEGPAGHIHVKM
jgi:selenium donor protein